MNKGHVFAIFSYICWGILPLYLQFVNQAKSLEILCHRIIWSSVLLLSWILVNNKIQALFSKLNLSLLFANFVAAMLIFINWGAYIWGVSNGSALDVSLGYFIMPLISVTIGRLFFNEKLTLTGTAGVSIAAVGVLYICLRPGAFPWLPILIAISFSLYGVVKKKSPLPAVEGLAIETLILLPLAMILLTWLQTEGGIVFLKLSSKLDALLIGLGIVTAFPLLLFAAATRKTSVSSIGMLQYISPSLQFVVGYFVFKETLSISKLFGFIIIWTGLLIYAVGVSQPAQSSFVEGR